MKKATCLLSNSKGFLLVFIASFSFGCSAITSDETAEEEASEEKSVIPLEMSLEKFQRTVGWLDEEEVLIHMGDQATHQLIEYNLFTGESSTLLEEERFFLTIALSPQKEQMFVQQIDGNTPYGTIVNRQGEETNRLKLPTTNYVSVDWNPRDPEALFLSYYNWNAETEEEEITVKYWDLETNEQRNMEYIDSSNLKWYSQNLYLFLEEDSENLYIGDIRTNEEPMIISRDVTDFFLHEDTVIMVTESDIRDDEIYLFHEFPFMVHTGAVSLPKTTMNEQVVSPRLTQARRGGEVFVVTPNDSYNLDKELGEYTLSKIDFESETIEEIRPLEYDAPILLSPNEEYLLYGWQLEKLIYLNDEAEIHPLLENS
jgi:hypothetical protein